MNVKEAVGVLKRAESIKICWNGVAIDIDKNDMLMMDAYGDYAVDEIAAADGIYEIAVAMRPIKEGVA